MALKSLLRVLTLVAVCTSALNVRQLRSSRLATTAPVDLPVAPFVVNLTEKVARSSAKKRILRELRTGSSGSLQGTDDDEEYVTSIIVGGQTFKAIIDTGRWVFPHKHGSDF